MQTSHGIKSDITVRSRQVVMRSGIRRTVCEYVEAHLSDESLTAEQVLCTLQLPRATLYRMFEPDGGLASYIRLRRLEAAASDLIRFPSLKVSEIAFGWGFSSASSFTRAFRRKFEISPQQMRLADKSVAPAVPRLQLSTSAISGLSKSPDRFPVHTTFHIIDRAAAP